MADPPETARPDRDPALEVAVQKAVTRRQPDYLSAHPGAPLAIECDVTLGYDAALRSLGAGTPEAQQALRELVKAASAFDAAYLAYQRGESLPDAPDVTTWEYWDRCTRVLCKSVHTFVALATPTEEER